MPGRYRWYERLFYYLVLREKLCLRLVFILVALLIAVQALLFDPKLRRAMVLAERLEGSEPRYYHSGRRSQP